LTPKDSRLADTRGPALHTGRSTPHMAPMSGGSVYVQRELRAFGDQRSHTTNVNRYDGAFGQGDKKIFALSILHVKRQP
jgi:hypothetical protein